MVCLNQLRWLGGTGTKALCTHSKRVKNCVVFLTIWEKGYAGYRTEVESTKVEMRGGKFNEAKVVGRTRNSIICQCYVDIKNVLGEIHYKSQRISLEGREPIELKKKEKKK